MESAIHPVLYEKVRAAFDQISGLPFPICANHKDGTFLCANSLARELFGIPNEAKLSDFNVADFYENRRDRAEVLRRTQNTSPNAWCTNLVRLKVGEARSGMRVSSQPFLYPSGELYALLSIANQMSDVEWFAEFEDLLDVGFFELDEDFKITNCNPKTAKILNYSTPSDLIGMVVSELFWEPEKAREIREGLLLNSKFLSSLLKLRCKRDTMVIVKMECVGITNESGRIVKIKGAIHDITHETLLNDLPVGLFMINEGYNNSEDIVSKANLTFAEMFGFGSVQEVVGQPANIFRPDDGESKLYMAALGDSIKTGKPLLDHYMKAWDNKGEKRDVVVNVHVLSGEKSEIRVGAVHDLTNHGGKRIRTLEADFGALLHTYIATVNGLRDTMKVLIKAHGHDVLANDKSVRDATTILLSGHRKRLETLLPELEKVAGERKVDKVLMEKVLRPWKRFSERQMKTEKDNASWARRNMIEMRSALESLRNTMLPRELLKNIRIELEEILRLTTVMSLSLSQDLLNERIPEFYYFRDYLRRKDTEMEDAKPQNFIPILVDAAQFLDEFASIREVNIVQHFFPQDSILVHCNRASLNRAFHCLLHNAIKYSWSRRGENPPYVDIRVEKKQDTVEILIENWGVAITREELDKDLLLQFGQRGRIADDRGRSGTGIGLYDAHNIITKHGGTLRLSSEPTFGNPPNVYTNPFITKVFITLPIAKQS